MATDTRLIQDWTPDSLGNPQGYSPGAANYVQIPDDYFKGPERQSYPVPKDGSHIVVNPPVDAKTLFIVNMSTANCTVRQPDTGEYYAAGGSTAVIPLRKGIAGGQFELFLQANYTGNGLIEIWFDENFYPPIVPFGSAIASAVTINGQPIAVTIPVPSEVSTHAGDIQAGSAVAGAFVDGSIATIGATTDGAQTGANGSVIAQLKGLFNRIINGAADAIVPANIGELAQAGFNGTTFDRLVTLAATGFGKGVPLKAAVSNVQNVTIAATALTTAFQLELATTAFEWPIRNRTLAVSWTGNQPLEVAVQIQTGSLIGNQTILDFTLPAGNVTPQVCIFSDLLAAAISSSGTPPTIVSGSPANLGIALQLLSVSVKAGAVPTSGQLLIEYIGRGA